jgi:hypothetical protein
VSVEGLLPPSTTSRISDVGWYCSCCSAPGTQRWAI